VRELGRQGTTVVLVTHNLFQARRMADDIALLIAGELVESGPATRLFERPSDPRTAAFLGGQMVY
jgi:tungstate transport system ATP-binding protein